MTQPAEPILLAHPAEPLELAGALRDLGVEVRRSSNRRALFTVFDRWLAEGSADVALMLVHEGLLGQNPSEVLEALRFAGVHCATIVLGVEERSLTMADRRLGIRASFGRTAPPEAVARAAADELDRKRRWQEAWQAIAARDLGRDDARRRGRSRSGTISRVSPSELRYAASSTRPPDE